MSRIFISYRRGDASADASRLREHLTPRFGDNLIFQDINSINPGQRFAAVIEGALKTCNVFLAVIGPTWLDCRNPDGARRLDDPQDWVRIEIAQALLREGVTVIPVLVRDARFPKSEELPEDLKALTGRHYQELRERDWKHHVEELIRVIEKELKLPARPVASARKGRGWWWKVPLAALAVAIAMIVAGVFDSTVPDVREKPVDVAEQMIKKSGLKVIRLNKDSDTPYDQVLWQIPDPGGHFALEEVRIGVSKGTPDLEKWASIRNTGTENAGAGVAMVTAMETAFAAQGRPTALSARYLLEKAKRERESRADPAETYLNAVVRVAEQFGAPPEESWPYRENRPELPTGKTWQQLDLEAARYRVKATRVASLKDIEEHLRRRRPVIAATDVYKESWLGEEVKQNGKIKPASSGKPYGRHSVVIVACSFGYPELIKFANVWGKQWGRQGFGTMSDEIAKEMLDLREMWAIEVVAIDESGQASK